MKMKSLLWTALALLCTGFDIPVAGIDILPDILGYFILFVCFSILQAHEGSFQRPRILSALLLLLQLAILLKLVEHKDILLILQVAGVLTDLLLFFFAFAALGRLAVSFEQFDLRRPIDSIFFIYAPTAALPLISDLAPEIEKLCLFVGVCLYLYVFNVIIRCYRQILLPVQSPDVEELVSGSLDFSEEPEELSSEPPSDSPSGTGTAEEHAPSSLNLPNFDE